MKRFLILISALVGLTVICILGYFYIKVEPKSWLGSIALPEFYIWSKDKSLFLQNFHNDLIRYEGAYIPPTFDKFLIDRLPHADVTEKVAIIDFYRSQFSGRRGTHIAKLDDTQKGQIIQYLISKVNPKDPDWRPLEDLVFIEYLRRDGNLYKGEFRQGLWTKDGNIIPEKVLDAKRRFILWWQNSKWPESKKIDPLKDSDIVISGVA